MLAAYNYNRDRVAYYYYYMNDLAWYNWTPTWRRGENPRHRMSLAGTYDLPFGKGRTWLSQASPVVNAFFGGWSTSSLLAISSGT